MSSSRDSLIAARQIALANFCTWWMWGPFVMYAMLADSENERAKQTLTTLEVERVYDRWGKGQR